MKCYWLGMRYLPFLLVLLFPGLLVNTAPTPRSAEQYRYLSYDEIVTRMQLLAKEHKDIISLSTAEQDFALKPVGRCGRNVCQVWILRLGTRLSEPKPRVFISGALHGDERVGAVVALEVADYLIGEHRRGNRWATRMLTTRHTVIIPMPNAEGFFTGRREEMGRDPNRDFAFDQACACGMRTAHTEVIAVRRRHSV